MESSQLWRQYIIAVIANIPIAISGYCMGWTSPIIPKLSNVTTSPLEDVLTTDQASWIGSLLPVGAVFGSIIGGFVAAIIGRKWGLLTCTIPMLTGWILIALTSNVAMIYAGRFFWGLAIGIMFTISPMYCSEIATDNARGVLGSYMSISLSLGFLLVYCMGPYLDYTIVAYIGVVAIVVFAIAFCAVPESPLYCLTKDDVESATLNLCKIRGQSREAVQAEITKMSAAAKHTPTQKKTKLSAIFEGGNFKAFYLSCGLIFLTQFCGLNAILFYMSIIFEAAGSGLDSSISTIIVGGVQVASSCVNPLVVDRLGRRTLMMISACGTALCNGLLGLYFVLSDHGYPIVDSLSYLPLVSLMLFIVVYSWGLGALPWIIMVELLPMQVKEVIAPIAAAMCWIMSILITKYFSVVVSAIGMGSTFFIFSTSCVILVFFTIFLLPETKGKSFKEIRDMLAGTNTEKL